MSISNDAYQAALLQMITRLRESSGLPVPPVDGDEPTLAGLLRRLAADIWATTPFTAPFVVEQRETEELLTGAFGADAARAAMKRLDPLLRPPADPPFGNTL